MKTILFKIQQFPHLSETFILNQITMAIELGFDVKILVKDILNFEESTHGDVINKYGISEKIIHDQFDIPQNKFCRAWKAAGILGKRIPDVFKIIKYFNLKSRFSLSWIFEIAFYEQLKNFDIIHVQYGTNVHPVDILKKVGLLKSKLIVSFHGHDAFFPINGFIQNNGYYHHLFTEDNLVIANTPYLAEKIKDLGCGGENLEVIPVPVDTEYFYPSFHSNNDNYLRVLTVGRLDPVKGHSVAIEFIKAISELIKVKLSIIGDGAEYGKLKELIKSYSLEKQVELVGRKSQEEVRDFMQTSHVYLFTGMPVHGGRRETQGLATLEAQACGLPVLAFDSGGVKYTVINKVTGYLCKEGDIKCLIDKIHLFRDIEMRKNMGAKARTMVEKNFSEHKIREKWKLIYCNA